MSEKNSFLGIGTYLKKINDSFDAKKSLSDVIDNFRCISKEYQEFNSIDQTIRNYSNNNYSLCTEDEKDNFDNIELETLECLVCNTIYDRVGILWNWKEIFDLIKDPIYKNTEKIQRKVVYSSMSNNRPIGDAAYATWNGLQIIDLDIKDAELAKKLKPKIFDDLKKFHWFLGICTSASGKSLHVWTKINPISVEFSKRKVEYLCNFRHKYSYVYIIMLKYAEKLGYTKDNILDYMDMAMAKPQQGIFITSDDNAIMNTNFMNLRMDVDFEPSFDTGVESINWITHPDLKSIFSKLEWFSNDKFDVDKNIQIENVSNINERDLSKTKKKHYKHAQRWQLANTLTAIYGFDKALQIMCQICSGTEYKELKGDIKTASIHNKPISLWAVSELNKYHGFKIKVKGDDAYEEEKEKLKEDKEELKSPTSEINDNKSNLVELYINKNQYLSDIKEDIIKNLSHITLLEAGAGYGKTEMIKALKAKTLLILPFTSTIKSKVEASETTSDWLYYYGNKRPTLDDILGDRNMSMTIDKFSKLNVMELDTANFEYIVLDESHLLFTSSYRSVMAPTIQRLANCKAKIIMMTGTPTGELLFFPNIKHIKVTKEDVRTKKFDIHFCPTKTEQLIEMCNCMAQDIIDGKKILFPTNNGNLYMEQVVGLIQEYLDMKKFTRPLNSFYYKKSNFNDESMDSINIDKTVGNNDIVFCTTYLSVGVDICDKYTFSVYFNQEWIPQDIEQFANRLRNNDLFIKMFLPKSDGDVPINYYFTQPLDLSFDKKDLLFARDIVRTCNDMLDRNKEEYKYNPLIQSLLSANKYLKFDENTEKYYIDETTYKLNVFEERYSKYSKQLEIMLDGIKYYGYKVDIIDHNDEIPDDKKEHVAEYLKECRNKRFNYVTTQTMLFLDHITDGNIDIYKELLAGNYEIFKNDNYQEESGENNLYTENIEILEKNTPIVIGLYKFYDIDTIKDIYQYCIDKKQNRINYTKLNRIRKFVNIESNIQKSRIDFPVYKFIKEAQDWAELNMLVSKEEIEEFLKEWSAKYANSVKDVVVDDIKYLEKIYEWITELWKVIIIQDRPKNKVIKVTPFKLLWDRRQSLVDIYGNTNTKDFFLQELVDNIKDDENEQEVKDEKLPELPHTSKYKLEDIEKTLKNVVHSSFDYFDYSTLDSSNKRFMEKQVNTNQLRDSLFGKNIQNDEIETTYNMNKKELNLFDNIENNTEFNEVCPF